MKLISNILVAFVAFIHLTFLVLEMFFWDHDLGRKIFSMTPEISASSAILAANQGLYNGFLAAGLIWALMKNKLDVKCFLLICIIVAGIYGGITAKATILFTQALPAFLALTTTLLVKRQK